MKTLIVDHSWTKIIERDESAKIVLAAKIEQIEEIEAAIRAVEGVVGNKFLIDEAENFSN